MIKKHVLNIVIIFALIFIAWSGILSQTLIGEGGYAYFFKSVSTTFTYNYGAILLFNFLMLIFKDNFFLYQAFELASFILIGILFYFFVYEFTQKKEIALTAGILFGVNFTSSFEMIGSGYYGDFVERVFFLIPLLISFILFFRFKNTKRKFYYIASLALCGFAIFLAHFNMFFMVFFLSYIAAAMITEISSIKKVFGEILLVSPFIFLSLFIVYLPILLGIGGFLSGTNFFAYLFSNANLIIFNSFRQLVVLTIPENILLMIVGNSPPLYKQSMHSLFIPVGLIYISAIIFICKSEKLSRIPIVASFLVLPIAFVLNMFMRGDNVDHLGSGSRYLFAPSVGFAIFWAIFFAHVVKKLNKNFIYAFIIFWFIIQLSSVNKAIDKEMYSHTETKKITAYLKNISPRLAEDSIVIVPNVMSIYGAQFCNLYYGKKKTLFLPFYSKIEWLDQYGRQFNPQKDIILTYDDNVEKVMDVTWNYKKIIVSKNKSE